MSHHAERPAKRRNGIAEATPFPENILMLFYECRHKRQFFCFIGFFFKEKWILAAVGCGEYENVETAVRCLVRVAETVEPTPELAEKYERKYRSFQQIYPAVKGLFSGALV